VFNRGESNTISLSKMVKTIEECVGKKAILNKMPMQPGDLKRTFADVSKSKEILGYDPRTSFEDGVIKFVSWLKGNS
jgi:UDP-glucuronate 4-epimerase